jgi:hypothetical protein
MFFAEVVPFVPKLFPRCPGNPLLHWVFLIAEKRALGAEVFES